MPISENLLYIIISRAFSGWIVLATATSINVLIAGELTVDLNIFLYLLNSLPSYLSLCPPVHRSIYLMPICLSPRANAPCMGYLFLRKIYLWCVSLRCLSVRQRSCLRYTGRLPWKLAAKRDSTDSLETRRTFCIAILFRIIKLLPGIYVCISWLEIVTILATGCCRSEAKSVKKKVV